MTMSIKEIAPGTRFGQWTVRRLSPRRDQSGNVLWWCKCACGEISEVRGTNLRSGYSTACRQCKAQLSLSKAREAKKFKSCSLDVA